ncbi:TPA: hypothetical protein KP562_001216 [Clostridioides difficile]|nr:hypothetical protein [Clostridioides difficile]
MIKIELTNEIKQYHKKYFETKIKPNFKGYKIEFEKKCLEDQHKAFMEFCSENYETLAIGDFDKLREINDIIKKNHHIILEMICGEKCRYKKKKHKKYKEDIKYKKVLIDIFGYNTFTNISIFKYIKEQDRIKTNENSSNGDLFNIDITMDNFKKHYKFKDIWNPYMFAFSLGIRVCPYCNRQYITPVYSSSGKLRADLDHFLPKNEYPFFSMSLYNLIPSCKFCNSSLKGAKEFDFDSLNPYECNIDDYIKFEIDLASNTKNIIVSPIKDKDKAKDYLNMFKIEALYNYHRNQASDLLKKKLIYSDEYLENMYKYFGNSFSSFDEMKELVIGYTILKENINDEPLAKFKRDISKQLGFIEEVDKDAIDKLKLLHTSITE